MTGIQTKFKTTKEKEFDIADAFPMTLGFVDDLMGAGVDISKLSGKKLPADTSFKLFKITLQQAGLTAEEVRQVSTKDMAGISAAIQHFMDQAEVESQGRPS